VALDAPIPRFWTAGDGEKGPSVSSLTHPKRTGDSKGITVEPWGITILE